MNEGDGFRVLSLDGGGIRGAFTAAFLAELEGELGGPMNRYFDLVAGTSTGGIVALALALGKAAEQILEFYRNRGPTIFKRRPTKGRWSRLTHPGRTLANRFLKKYDLDADLLWETKYDSKALGNALRELFGSLTLEAARTRLLVPAVDLVSGKTTVFKTPHLSEAATRDRRYAAVDVALATAAAPTYFPHATLRTGSAYCDGGLWANNPSMVAIVEAERIASAQGMRSGFKLDDVYLLSIGTGNARYSLIPPASNAGIAWWAPRIVDVMSNSQSWGTTAMADFILRDRHFRVDYELPDSSWTLDCIEHLDRLIHLGREAAHREISRLRPVFFQHAVEPFVASKAAQGTA